MQSTDALDGAHAGALHEQLKRKNGLVHRDTHRPKRIGFGARAVRSGITAEPSEAKNAFS
jgi:hypothetical protein